MKKLFITLVALLGCLLANGETMKVNKFRYAGPYSTMPPYMLDKTDVNAKAFDAKGLLENYISFEAVEKAPFVESVPAAGQMHTLNLIGFTLQAKRYASVELKVSGL